MEHFYLLSREVKYNNWILNIETPARHVMPEYSPFVCKRCGKVDEVAAVRSGIRKDLKVRGAVDFLRSSDGLTIFSERARKRLSAIRMSGLDFTPIGVTGYYVAMPNRFIPVDVAASTMKFQRKCPQCNRFRETTGLPSLESMKLPTNPCHIVAPDVFIERQYSRTFIYIVSSRFRDLFIEQKELSGAVFDPV